MPRLTDKWSLRPETIGVYLPRRAGALAGVSGNTVGQWARHGLITPTVYEGRPRNLYSYFDVAEAIVVRWLLDQGFSHAEIRNALAEVRDGYPDWPLLNAPLGVGQQTVGDRGQLVRSLSRDVHIDVTGRAPEQLVIPPTLLDDVRNMLTGGGWLADKLGLRRIEVKPHKLGGQPSLRGKRWTLDHVARLAADDRGRRILIDGYGLEPDEVDEAISWTEAAEALA